MKDSTRYVKRVEWSDEDQCFVGSCPGVIGPCCHGAEEVAVYRELCGIVDEWLEIIRDEDGTLPEPADPPLYSTAAHGPEPDPGSAPGQVGPE